MSQKAIREFDGKLMLSRWLKSKNAPTNFIWDRFFQVLPSTVLSHPPTKEEHQWLLQEKLVAKPDQLIKRRGKAGLIKLNAAWPEAVEWISSRRGKECKVEHVSGVLDHFLIEQFMPHNQDDEYYICIVAKRGGDEILFHHQGGVDIGDVDSKAVRLVVAVGDQLTEEQVASHLLINVPSERRASLAHFIRLLYEFSDRLHYSYLEINPLVVTADGRITPLDMAAKIDETAKFEVGTLWGKVQFPPPFGRPLLPAEAFIQELDSKTGASLKLTVLNPHGRIWTMVAGGGASVIFADTVADLGFAAELANYGEYSGAPDEEQTYLYAKTILELLLAEKHPQGKILIIGGGIANFTNVGETFKGIIRALTQFSAALIEHNVKIYVRRGGPNYQEGLEAMRNLAKQQDLFIEVFGPETHMTSIVPLALGMPIAHRVAKLVPEIPQTVKPTLLNPKASPAKNQQRSIANGESKVDALTAAPSSPSPTAEPAPFAKRESVKDNLNPSKEPEVDTSSLPPQLNSYDLFTNKTRAIIFGLQPQAVQNMLDFDFICGRKNYSVVGMVYPFTGNHYMKFYWKAKEVLIPVFEALSDALSKFPEVDVIVNFASCRSVLESTLDFLKYKQIRTVAIIAEGVPERHTRKIIREAAAKNVRIIGPATVGGIKPGAFRIGNTGGALDNVISSRLYRPGSVAYVARSGGMSNEMNNIISHNSDGVYEGIAIGGDQYPGTTFIDHLVRYQDNPDVKMLVVLGEVGGVEEYEICKLIDSKRITKPMVAWCIGTCSSLFPYEVQFGHAGARAGADAETATAKNKALSSRGVSVPQSFDDFGQVINDVYVKLVENGTIQVREEMPVPTVPVDYEWARKLGLIRKPAAFISSIVDDRGDELEYAGIKISEVLQSGLGVGGVLGLIWFRKRLPDYACRFIELVLMVTADHGPAVAGAHNTIVAARAGKDLISSLCSGLLTIGPRFGGALDGAAAKFSSAFDSGLSAEDFVNKMRRDKELIPGIGHRIKSLENPDMRVVIVKSFVKKHFPNSQILSYAEQVELITTKKKSNLILNVDGAIACAFVDLLRSCGAFTLEEANDYVKMGCLNGLFVLGRSIGLIGHFIDQNRLKQPLYRHPAEDISYLTKDALVI